MVTVNTNLKKPREHISGLAPNNKQPRVELLQAVVQVLQSLQQEPAQKTGIFVNKYNNI